MKMKRFTFLPLLVLSTFAFTACTTSRGLRPVDDFFEKGGGKDYIAWTNEDPKEGSVFNVQSAEGLKAELNDVRATIKNLREKQYSIMNTLLGQSFERDLGPIDEFFDDETGEKFAFKQLIEEKVASGELDDDKANRRLRELETIQDLIDGLIAGQEPLAVEETQPSEE